MIFRHIPPYSVIFRHSGFSQRPILTTIWTTTFCTPGVNNYAMVKMRPKASHGRVHTMFICVGMTFLTGRRHVHANNGIVYLCSNDLLKLAWTPHAIGNLCSNYFLTWRGRVRAIVYLCSNDFFNLAWTRPCQQWHGRVHAKSKK